MARSVYSTAANILSSLGIRGATVDDKLPGRVPVLNNRGEIDASLIPGFGSAMSAGRLSNVAIVDPGATDDSSDSSSPHPHSGSITDPFRSLSDAASWFEPSGEGELAKRVAFMMAPGVYNDISVNFSGPYHPLHVYFIGIGECILPQYVTIEGLSPAENGVNPSITFHNVVSNGTVSVTGSPTVLCVGHTYISELEFGDAPSARVVISSDSRVSSTNAAKVLMSDAGNVGNNSEVVGSTVADAMSRLGRRKVRIAKITVGSSGLDIGSSYVDVSASSCGNFDVFDISEINRAIAAGVNGFIGRGTFRTVDAVSVTADSVDAGIVDADVVETRSIKLGSYRMRVDTYGYIVIDGSSS